MAKIIDISVMSRSSKLHSVAVKCMTIVVKGSEMTVLFEFVKHY
jgi:hypothetical protein